VTGFDPTEILRILDTHEVCYVLIGGMAATLHGAEYVTADLDITPSTVADNLDRLSAALSELDAHIRAPGEVGGLPFSHDAASLARADVWNLTTRFGDLDLAFRPAGTAGYDDLRRDAVTIDIHGVTAVVASLADVVRSKAAAGRDKDRQALPMLRRLLDAEPRPAP
jgi:hypothetical protein